MKGLNKPAVRSVVTLPQKKVLNQDVILILDHRVNSKFSGTKIKPSKCEQKEVEYHLKYHFI